MAEEIGTASNLMIAVAQGAAAVRRHQFRQYRLAILQCRAGQIPAIEIEQVERVKHERVGSLIGDGVLQMAEIGCPVGFDMDQLAID